jgi:hypothetical protein
MPVAGQQETWRLAVVWRDPAKGEDEIASFALTGLTESHLCRLLGIPGNRPPGFPVPVHVTELHRLRPYSSEPLSFPDGATGELWPVGGESTKPRELWPLLACVVVGGTLGALLWHWGRTAHSTWARFALQLGGGVSFMLAVWCAMFLLMLFPLSLIARRKRVGD